MQEKKDSLIRLIDELRGGNTEKPWVEFKVNNFKPEMIGEDISALANSAVLYERDQAYMIWGVNNETHEVEGTSFAPEEYKHGNEELENWLRGLLSDNASYKFQSVQYKDGIQVVVLTVQRAVFHTVTFQKNDYIRVGTYTKKLKDYPELQREFWEKLRTFVFETQPAKENISENELSELLDFDAYFEKLKITQPSNRTSALFYFLEDGLIRKQDNGLYLITNLGALLFARDMSKFPFLFRKAIRVVQYSGSNKKNKIRDQTFSSGYAASFDSAMTYIMALIPAEEQREGATRSVVPFYPETVLREILGNAIIHQDLTITGASPLVEVFDTRIELTNPGKCMVDIKRIVDNPPRSRNQYLSALMRRMDYCDEAGSGWDDIVIACEESYLATPEIYDYQDATRVVIRFIKSFSNMSHSDRMWSCYMHACIQQINDETLTNSSLRKRFNLQESSSGTVSRLIKDAVEEHLIHPVDPDTAPRYMKYVPFWA